MSDFLVGLTIFGIFGFLIWLLFWLFSDGVEFVRRFRIPFESKEKDIPTSADAQRLLDRAREREERRR